MKLTKSIHVHNLARFLTFTHFLTFSRTVKQGCDAHLRLVKVKDGNKYILRVKSLELSHKNHPVDQKVNSLVNTKYFKDISLFIILRGFN